MQNQNIKEPLMEDKEVYCDNIGTYLHLEIIYTYRMLVSVEPPSPLKSEILFIWFRDTRAIVATKVDSEVTTHVRCPGLPIMEIHFCIIILFSLWLGTHAWVVISMEYQTSGTWLNRYMYLFLFFFLDN